MRKIFLTVAALVFLLVARTPLHVYAAGELTFSVGSVGTVTRGETITVPITVSNNPGFTTVGLVVNYDPNILEIMGVTAPVAAMPLNSQFALTSTPGTQWIHLINTSLVDWNGNGVVANITFYVKSGATAGASNISLGFTNTPDGSPANASGAVITDTETISTSMNVISNTGGTGGSPSGSGNAGTAFPTSTPTSTSIPTQAPTTTNTPTLSPEPAATPTPAPTVLADNDESNNIDDGGFIGNLDIPDDTGSGTRAIATGGTGGGSSFGKVPQTGVPDITGMVVALCVSFMTTAALWVYILRRKCARGSNGKA